MYFILNFVNPKYIIDINWTSKWNSLYKVWTKKHQNSKFIVVQHGSYVAGVVNDNAHKYTKCDVFFTWSDYFKEMFKNYNKNKQTQIIPFGNSIYNNKNRDCLSYSNTMTSNVLLAPSVIADDKLKFYFDLIKKLETLGFNIFIKEHAFQGKCVMVMGNKVNFPVLNEINKMEDKLEEILKKNNFDFVISDHSTALLDAIFFKNKVIYFSPKNKNIADTTNQYSKYLINIYDNYENIKSKREVYSLLSVNNQERLLSNLIKNGDNILTAY